ncbi:MAG: hypothetical protein AAGA91_14315 [Pseudomonadota bacterium]
MDYLTVAEARERSGLRLVLVAGTPGAWGEVVKAIYHVKGIQYQPVAQRMGQENPELLDWTGQTSAPVVMYDSERPRITWDSMLWHAEQLVPEPRLIPADAREQAAVFGLVRAFAGECGFAWDRRLQSISAVGGPSVAPELARLAHKYGYSETEVEAANVRLAGLLGYVSDVLEEQRDRGSRYLVGDALSAADLYCAVMTAIMLQPLPDEDIPMPEGMRFGFSQPLPCLKAARPIVFEHRQYVFDTYLETPFSF